MEVVARQDGLCLDEAALPRRVLVRGALLALFAGALFVVGLILSQPAHAAVAGTPGTTAPAGTVAGVTGAVTGTLGSASGTASQAGTAATQAVRQAAGQVPGLAGSTATQAAVAAASTASDLGNAAGTAVSQVGGAAGQALGTVTQAVGSAAQALGNAATAPVSTGGTAPGGTPQPSPKHHHGHAGHRHHHRRGQQRRHNTPGGRPGRSFPAPGPAGRRMPGPANQPNPAAAHVAHHGYAVGGRDHPKTPSPVLPAVPATPPAGSPSGAGAPQTAHAPAGLPAQSAPADGSAARIPAQHPAGWITLLRGGRGPHRPG